MAISITTKNVFFGIMGVAAVVTGAAIITMLVGNILNNTGHSSALASGLETYGKWTAIGGAGSFVLTLGVKLLKDFYVNRKG